MESGAKCDPSQNYAIYRSKHRVNIFMRPYQKIGGHIVLPLSFCLSVRPSVCVHKLNVKT